jgi:hypothetical protein
MTHSRRKVGTRRNGSYDVRYEIAPPLDLLLATFWTTGVIGLLMRRSRTMRSFLDRPFVLFLRKFSTFADRAVIASMLKQATHSVPIVFLTPTHSRPRDWDPYLVCFAGLKLLHPWRSAPIVIRERDDAWQRTADELIRRARTILLDTSETTTALREEAEMLDRACRWPSTVCLSLSAHKARPDPAPMRSFGAVRTIGYTKSWLRALPRMVLGVPIVILGMGFSIFTLTVIPLEFLYRSTAFLADAPRMILFAFELFRWVTALARISAGAAYYYSAFMVPRGQTGAEKSPPRVTGRAHK